MTGLLEAPPAVSESTDAARRTRSARWRADLRLARRQVLRAKGASLLIAALVALPMIALSAAAVVWASHKATVAEEVAVELGAAQSRVEIVHGPDSTLTQSATEPYSWDIDRDIETGTPRQPERPPLTDPVALFPERATWIEIGMGTVRAVTPGGQAAFAAIVGPAWDPVLAGRYEQIAGAAPRSADEAMVSPGALDRLGVGIGDTMQLADPAASLTITGVLKAAEDPDAAPTVFVPATKTTDAVVEYRSWFSPDWQPTEAQLPQINREGVIVFARDLMLAREDRYVDPAAAWLYGALIAMVVGFAGYLVVLLAGAAFSVSARRQQHTLAVASSVGASRGSLLRIVLLQGTVLGLIGGVAGAAIGIAAAYPVLALLDDGQARSFWGFHVPWWAIAGIVLFAVGVGTAAAALPARAATRGDVLQALRGARLPTRLRARLPLWGAVFLAVGLAVTIASGLLIAGLNTAETIDYQHPMRTAAVTGIIAGPLLFQVGVIVAGHWILTVLARGFARLGLAARLAARDAAAHPGRVVPAFGAIGACVFLAAFALSAVSISSASSARDYWWQGPEGSVVATMWPTSPETQEGAVNRALAALDETKPSATALVRGEPTTYDLIDVEPTDELLATVWRAEVFHAPSCDDPDTVGWCLTEGERMAGWESAPHVIAADELAVALGAPVPAEAMRVFQGGGAIVLPSPWMLGSFEVDGSVRLNAWHGADVLGEPESFGEPLRTVTLPAAPVDLGRTVAWRLLISPETADALGMTAVGLTAIAVYDEPISTSALDRLTAITQEGTDAAEFTYSVENGPIEPSPWLWLILAAVGVLVLGSGSVALGLARVERRPDDATLAAVGAPARLRRGVAFWQALVIVGLGALSGTIAGLIPMWGIALAIEGLDVADAPWSWLALLALGLPLAIAAAAWLVPPRHPDLTRRTAIA